jgi:RHS repeat-associated protein
MPMPIDRNGYIAVYTESRTLMPLGPCTTCGDVFFDNLSVRVTSGRLKEETHYYPFGLPMKGMGTDAGNNVLNRQKYQSNEYIKELGLNWMSFGARQYDPQLGRFLSIDPLADGQGQQIWSPYSAMGNAPESMIDPNGESVIDMQSMVMINGASPVWNESDAYADHNQGNGYEPPPDLEEMAAAGFEYLAEATQANSGNSGNENTVVAVFVNVVDGGSMTLANASTTDATKETGETTKSDGDQPNDGGGGKKGNTPGPFTTDEDLLTPREANARLTLSDAGYGFIMAWEDFRATKYDANPGKGDWTIGYGHKIKKGENFDGKTITQAEALALLRSDMPFFEDRVKRNISVALSQQQFDALVIFDMNVRGGLSRNTTITDAVNRNADMGTMQKIWYMYSSPNDPRIHQGVLNRRMDEFQIWQYRNYTRDY